MAALVRGGFKQAMVFRRGPMIFRFLSSDGKPAPDEVKQKPVRRRLKKGDASSERLNIVSLKSLSMADQKSKKSKGEETLKAEKSSGAENAAGDQTVEATKTKRERPEKPGAWKWIYRKRVWEFFKLPLFRFPNFDGARKASEQLFRLPEFRSASCVYVGIDTPQRIVRVSLMRSKKQMLVSRLPKELFSLLDPNYMSELQITQACQQAEFRIEGKPVGLDDKGKVQVDIIVIGSVAVDPLTGARLGKGEGYAEYEYAMLRYLEAVDESTLVVTTVHDEQLLEDIPAKLLLGYDLPVDVICTPTQIIRTNRTIRKPTGILWNHVLPEKLHHLPFLRQLKEKLESESGEKIYLAEYRNRRLIDWFPSGPAIFISDINPSTTEDELIEHLTSLKVDSQGVTKVYKTSSRKAVARVVFPKSCSVIEVDKFVARINNSKLKEWRIKARRDLRDNVKQLVCTSGEEKTVSTRDGTSLKNRELARTRMSGM